MASVFSGSAGRKAATWTADQARQQFQALQGLYGQNYQGINDILNPAFQQADTRLTGGYRAARGDINRGAWGAQEAIRQGAAAGQGYYGDAIGNLNQRYGQGEATYNRAAAGWDPLIAENMKGFNMLGNALGISGAEGNAAARGAFQAGPGYQWQVDQASDAAARSANKLGMTYSGNTTDAITRLGSNLANQEYQQWIQNLQPYQTGAHNAVAGQSGVLENLAGMYQGWGKDLATVNAAQAGLAADTGRALGTSMQTQGQNLGTLAYGYGTDRAQLPVAQATALANNLNQYTNQQADATNNYWNSVTGAGQQGMMAGQQAAANQQAAIMGGLQLATQFLRPGGGGGQTPNYNAPVASSTNTVGGGGIGSFLKSLFG